jgi:SsrA-binding protein
MAQQTADVRTVVRNRKARHDYIIEDTLEAGIALMGSEVKSLRGGSGSIAESYAGERKGEIYLFNAHIPEYKASRENHDPRRARKLLLHRREIDRLSGLLRREGATLVPLSIYFNARGIAKLRLGIAHGKRKADKRQAVKERDWQRQKARLMRERG